jgi:Peptidase family M23
MRRLILTTATTLLAFLLLASPAWADWVWPLGGEVITPFRNGDDPYASGQHRGIDIAGDTGAPVVAAAGGEVRFAGTAGSSGLTVSIRTADGRYDTSYLHLSSVAVSEGDRIAAGERVGAVGTTGVRSAASPHLHFGVRDAGSRHAYHDPLDFLPPAPPAPAAPREAPAPQPAPVPPVPVPEPAPVQAPAGRRVPVRVPAGRRVPVRVPAGRRIPVRAPVARRVPVRAPVARRVPVRAPRTGGVPAGRPAPVPNRAPGVQLSPRHERASAPAPGPVRAGERPALPGVDSDAARIGVDRRMPASASPASSSEHEQGSGPDLGLILACLGLLAAAALLGLTEDGQKATRRTGQRIARVFQPLLGRR